MTLGVLAMLGGCADALTSAQRQAEVDEQTKRLLISMDRDQNGKVSKQEFLHYMAVEFDRLDTDHGGDLDPAELTQLHARWHTISR
ncbi:MAG: hypothetical protein JOY71_09905 [Acetobacteraceae bacterium]|nr:hypothetical protein [Acetobacteraceae bacterium]